MIFISDTSTERCQVIVAEGNELRASLELNTGLQHGSTYQVAIAKVMELANIKPEDIDVWAVVTGPGSYTGLRIAVAATKMYAYLYDKPCVEINALEARAWTLLGRKKREQKILAAPILDARNERCWSGLYRWEDEHPVSLRETISGPVKDLMEEIKKEDFTELRVGGLKVPKTTKELLEHYFPGKYSLDLGGFYAEDLVQAAAYKVAQKDFVTADELAVHYYSLSQAERQLAQKKGGKLDLPKPEFIHDDSH